jgi:hypothetical protein
VRAYLIEHHRVALSATAEANLTVMIADRLAGINGEKQFFDALKQPIKEGGIGLKEKIAEDMSRYMEKLIAIGVDVSYKA